MRTTEQSRSDQARARARWRAEGRCGMCGRERDDGNYATCGACRAKSKRYAKPPRSVEQREQRRAESARAREQYRSEGRCTICGHPVEPGSAFATCVDCRQRVKNHNDARRPQRALAGTCRNHATPRPLFVGGACRQCWFSGMAKVHTGSTKNAAAIEAMLRDQRERCYLCDGPLIPGVNATMDHVVPISRGGARSLENVRWADATCNAMKGAQMLAELLARCEVLLRRSAPA